MNIVSPCLFCLGYTSAACSNLAQEFSVPSTVICRKEAWTPGLNHVYREVFCRLGSTLGPGFKRSHVLTPTREVVKERCAAKI